MLNKICTGWGDSNNARKEKLVCWNPRFGQDMDLQELDFASDPCMAHKQLRDRGGSAWRT